MEAFMKFMVGLGGGLLIHVGGRRVDFEAALFLSFMDLVLLYHQQQQQHNYFSSARRVCAHWFSLFRVSSTHH